MELIGSNGLKVARTVVISLFLLWAGQGFAGTTPAEPIVTFDSPGEGFEATEKKPTMRFSSNIPVGAANLLVLLDGVDITGVLEFPPGGFEYRPDQSLPNGQHQIHVTVYRDDGTEAEQEFAFSTLYRGFFDQVSSNTQVSAVYEQALKKPVGVPRRNLATNLGTTNLVTKGKWEVGFNTNLRYLERSAPILAPEKKGFDLVDYRLSGRYAGENLGLLAEMGDLQLQETQNTVMGLARRGARAELNYRSFSLSSFMVQSEQVFGFDGGLGLDFNENDNIKGVAGGIKLFSDALTLRTIYVTGGEKGSSFGLYTEGGDRKGDVLAFVLQNQLLDGKLTIGAEYDLSDFDADTSDEFSSETDRAWSLKAGGYAGNVNYQALYEYVGPDYEVVGNRGLQRDREGFTVNGGIQSSLYALTLSGSRYEDNVKEDPLFPQTSATMGMADFSFNRFPAFPMGLSVQRTIMDSSMVPEFGMPIKTYTDMIGARINHPSGPWNFSLNANYSRQDDRTDVNYDTKTQTYSFVPMYYSEHFSFTPSLSFNRSSDDTSGTDTDTYTATLDLRGDLFSGKCLYEFAGTFNRMEMSRDAMKMDSLNSNFRVAYVPGTNYFGFLNPSIGLRGLYNKTNDRLSHQSNEDFALLLVISTSLGISL